MCKVMPDLQHPVKSKQQPMHLGSITFLTGIWSDWSHLFTNTINLVADFYHQFFMWNVLADPAMSNEWNMYFRNNAFLTGIRSDCAHLLSTQPRFAVINHSILHLIYLQLYWAQSRCMIKCIYIYIYRREHIWNNWVQWYFAEIIYRYNLTKNNNSFRDCWYLILVYCHENYVLWISRVYDFMYGTDLFYETRLYEHPSKKDRQMSIDSNWRTNQFM